MAGLLLNRSRQVPAEETPAFAGIAERFRRAGDLDRAIALCRDGLKRFPTQLSARVTLGWALLDRGEYDEARAELEQVIRRAPDNLAAIRGLAELHDRADNAPGSMDGASEWQLPAMTEPESLPAALAPDSQAVAEPAAPEPVPDWSTPLAVPGLTASAGETPEIINVPHESLSFATSEVVGTGIREQEAGGSEREATGREEAAEAFSVTGAAHEVEAEVEAFQPIDLTTTGDEAEEIEGLELAALADAADAEAAGATEPFVLSPFEAHETTIDLDAESGEEVSNPAPTSELPAGVGSLDFGDPFVQPEPVPLAAASAVEPPAPPVPAIDPPVVPAAAASAGLSLDLPAARSMPSGATAAGGRDEEPSPDLGVVSIGPLGDVPIDVSEPIRPVPSLGAVELAGEAVAARERTSADDDPDRGPRPEPVPEAASSIHDYELPAASGDSDAVWGFGRAAIAAPAARASEAVPVAAPVSRPALRSLERLLRKVEARRLQLQLQSGSPA
jgi:hypothetical protein